MLLQVTFLDINDARSKLDALPSNSDVCITNHALLVHSCGMLSVDYIMRTLKKEYSIIKKCVVNCAGSLAAQISAQELGYNELICKV